MTEGVREGTGVGEVAVRVAALCLDPSGRLSDRLVCGPAVRGALLLDLALTGRVEQTEESILVDPTPTGFAPADRMLAAIGVEPERSLDGWLDERRIGLRDVAAAAVATGQWREVRAGWGRRRYADARPERTATDRHRLPDRDAGSWAAADACVCAVASSARLLEFAEHPATAVLPAAGAAAWLAEAVVDHLRVLTARYAAEAAGLGPF